MFFLRKKIALLKQLTVIGERAATTTQQIKTSPGPPLEEGLLNKAGLDTSDIANHRLISKLNNISKIIQHSVFYANCN